MIEKMQKIYLVARNEDRDQLMEMLGKWGVVHLMPVDAAKAVPDEKAIAQAERLERALQILEGQSPAPTANQIDPEDAATQTLRIQREGAELTQKLSGLYQQVEQNKIWGDIRLEQFEQLNNAGIMVEFFSIATEQIDQVQAECVQPITVLADKRSLIAVIDRPEAAELPDSSELIPLPTQDRASLLAEAAQIDQKLKENQNKLNELANLIPVIQEKLHQLQDNIKLTIATRSGWADDNLFALQGWIPQKNHKKLAQQIDQADISIGFQTLTPDHDEEPPTAITYPVWAKPIQGLFDILGTLPGYKEIDLAPFFMVALPVFAAMLIGDAGYGLVFLLPAIIFYRKMTAAAGKEKTHLLMIIGACTMIWGILTANFFGVTPNEIALAGGFTQTVAGDKVADVAAMQTGSGFWSAVGKTMITLAPLWDVDPDKARALFIKISLLFGALHLVLAHLRQALAFLPNPKGLAEIGWCLFLSGMLGIIWILFFGPQGLPIPMNLVYAALISGACLFIFCTAPSWNPLKMIGVGLASSLLPMLGTFSDTMSYIRLMAVGLASYYIASAFNSLGAAMAPSATWFGAAPVIIFGHALNIALCVIAIFAHGVRLNMLEFSNNAGVQWSGYAYSPFTR